MSNPIRYRKLDIDRTFLRPGENNVNQATWLYSCKTDRGHKYTTKIVINETGRFLIDGCGYAGAYKDNASEAQNLALSWLAKAVKDRNARDAKELAEDQAKKEARDKAEADMHTIWESEETQ